MPRHRRIVVPNYPHHLVQRGHNKLAVFFTDYDRAAYLDTLQEFKEKLGLQIHSYCLMTNHVHLIINPGNEPANLGLLMKRLAGRHTRRINRIKTRTGTSWEGRFKCSPIDTNNYLLACTRYVDLNPVRAGIADRPEDYRWSSYRSRAGLEPNSWLDPDPCYLALATTVEERQRRYREFVSRDIPTSEIELLRSAVQRNQLTGSDGFVIEIERVTGMCIPTRARGRPLLSTPPEIESPADRQLSFLR